MTRNHLPKHRRPTHIASPRKKQKLATVDSAKKKEGPPSQCSHPSLIGT